MTKSNRFLRHLDDGERALLDAVVAFANFKEIKSTQQVERLFTAVPLTRGPFKILRRHETAVYRKEQATVAQWLGFLARGGEDARNAVALLIAPILERTVTVRVSFDLEKSELRVIGLLDGVEACVSYA